MAPAGAHAYSKLKVEDGSAYWCTFAASVRSRCGSVRWLPLLSSQPSPRGEPQIGQRTEKVSLERLTKPDRSADVPSIPYRLRYI